MMDSMKKLRATSIVIVIITIVVIIIIIVNTINTFTIVIIYILYALPQPPSLTALNTILSVSNAFIQRNFQLLLLWFESHYILTDNKRQHMCSFI